MINVTNKEFINAIFGEDAPWVHVTDFSYDPNNIPDNRHLNAWKGDYFSRYNFGVNTNQYFTISCFFADDQGTARRRKALYRHTNCVVLDDVREKLSEEEAQKLPTPSWIMETSPGSFQWGYILTKPETNAFRIDNLNDGLIASNLAPDGKDPGQRGVTRYVRLPEGYNTKQSKMINGQPFKCTLTQWNPFSRVTLEQLAAPFHVNLDASRRETRVDGAADVSDHPLINIPDILHIKEVRSDGRFDITCPWVDEHTGGVDNGAGIFTNKDNSIGFKCHHGACQHRTGNDLLNYIENKSPGFKREFTVWKTNKEFQSILQPNFMEATVAPVTPVQNDVSFMVPASAPVANPPSAPTPANAGAAATGADSFKEAIDSLHRMIPTSHEARDTASNILKMVDELSKMDQVHYHKQICDIMGWSKPDFTLIMKDLRTQWYASSSKDVSFFDSVMYIGELNRFYDRAKQIFYTPESYQNNYAHLDADARKEALQGGRVTKVDKLDYAPKKPPVFTENGVLYGNSWSDVGQPMGVPGDVSRWLNHFDVLGWGEYRDHIVKWMAFTIRHPDIKINHMLIFGSGEGSGKDWLLTPLTEAMGVHGRTVEGEQLTSQFNEYLMSVKYLNINETELGDRREAMAIGAKLKPIAAAPPEKLHINPKGVSGLYIRNIVNGTMTTNSQLPIRLNGPSRRFLALWTDVIVRDDEGNMTPQWAEYWKDRWDWMKNGGADNVIHYLRNVVDLSDFEPAAPPPVTEFLRDIQDSSKPTTQLVVEDFIKNKVSVFKSDLLTSSDMTQVLRNGEMVAPHLMYTNGSYFTPQSIGRILKNMPSVKQMRGKSGHNQARIWVLRNYDKYMAMTPSDVIYSYQEQLQKAKAEIGLQAVGDTPVSA